jgi:methyltransferase-like protein
MMIDRFDEETIKVLNNAPLPQQEQYIDFLTARSFRRSLLCRAEGKIDRTMTKDRLRGLFFSLTEPLDAQGEEALQTRFVGQSRSITTNHPILEALLEQLVENWPGWRSAEQLQEQVYELLGASAGTDLLDSIREDLLLLISRGAVLARHSPPPIAVQPADNPVAHPWARLQCEQQQPYVTNCRHVPVALAARHIFVLSRLDGSRSREQLCADMADAFQAGILIVRSDKGAFAPMDGPACALLLDNALQDLAHYSLLLG